MIRLKRVSKPEELQAYCENLRRFVKISLPSSYLGNSKIHVIYSKKKIIGGFLINESGHYRSLQSLPDKGAELKRNGFLMDHHKDLIEVNGVWLDPDFRDSVFTLVLFLWLAAALFFHPRKYFLYTFSSKSKSLKRLYSAGSPVTIYEGVTLKLEGMTYAEEETIQINETKKASIGFVLQLRWMILSLLKKRWNYAQG